MYRAPLHQQTRVISILLALLHQQHLLLILCLHLIHLQVDIQIHLIIQRIITSTKVPTWTSKFSQINLKLTIYYLLPTMHSQLATRCLILSKTAWISAHSSCIAEKRQLLAQLNCNNRNICMKHRTMEIFNTIREVGLDFDVLTY